MTIEPDLLAEALRETLPSVSEKAVSSLADIIAGITNGSISSSQARERVLASDELRQIIQELSGQTINTPQGALAFGQGTQLGDVAVDSIAGGNIINFNLYMQQQAQNHQSITTEQLARSGKPHLQRNLSTLISIVISLMSCLAALIVVPEIRKLLHLDGIPTPIPLTMATSSLTQVDSPVKTQQPQKTTQKAMIEQTGNTATMIRVEEESQGNTMQFETPGLTNTPTEDSRSPLFRPTTLSNQDNPARDSKNIIPLITGLTISETSTGGINRGNWERRVIEIQNNEILLMASDQDEQEKAFLDGTSYLGSINTAPWIPISIINIAIETGVADFQYDDGVSIKLFYRGIIMYKVRVNGELQDLPAILLESSRSEKYTVLNDPQNPYVLEYDGTLTSTKLQRSVVEFRY